MTTTDILNLILSVCTVSIAGFALWQTHKQIKISNKQHLFDRRLEKFLLIRDLISLYKNNSKLLNKETIAELVDMPFNWLINCARLEETYCIMQSPLGDKEKKIFLSKCEELEHSAVEIKLIWRNDYGNLASKFVSQYVNLLRAMHRQQIVINDLEEKSARNPLPLEVTQERNMTAARTNGLFSAIDDIKVTYEQMESCSLEAKLEESISLPK